MSDLKRPVWQVCNMSTVGNHFLFNRYRLKQVILLEGAANFYQHVIVEHPLREVLVERFQEQFELDLLGAADRVAEHKLLAFALVTVGLDHDFLMYQPAVKHVERLELVKYPGDHLLLFKWGQLCQSGAHGEHFV